MTKTTRFVIAITLTLIACTSVFPPVEHHEGTYDHAWGINHAHAWVWSEYDRVAWIRLIAYWFSIVLSLGSVCAWVIALRKADSSELKSLVERDEGFHSEEVDGKLILKLATILSFLCICMVLFIFAISR